MTFLDDKTWTGKVFTGTWTRPAGGDLAVFEPATGAELGRVGLATTDDVASSATRAAEAQRGWAATSFQERAAIMRRAGDLWVQHADELRTWLVRESGSTRDKADFELHVGAQECYAAAALAGHPAGEVLASEAPRLSLAQRVPAGVVGVISPFNAPVILSIRSVAPALALGNSVLLKPDPRTPVSGGVALARIFEEAGLPAGVLHVLPGGADVGSALVTDPRVRVIAFTGSTRAGRSVGELAGRHLKRAHLELGGNSALIVLEDADLDATMSAAAFASFFNQGQGCMATGRHLVHESLYDEYVARLAEKAARLSVGDPYTQDVALGPIIDAAQRDRVHSLVTSTVDAGARLVVGGAYQDLFYQATVLADAGPSMPAYDQETFGPIAPVTKFATLDEAVKLASDSEYGLSLGIITADAQRGMQLADRIPTGIAHINDQTINDEAQAPFGGVASSGTGSRFGGAAANIEAFTETRWVTVRTQPPTYPF